MSFNFNNPSIKNNMHKGSFGIEKESLRADTNGFLSHTKHPFADNPHIDRDFCENQVEIVTDVYTTTEQAYKHLARLHNTVIRELNGLESGREILWLFSNPPYVKNENDIPIASYKGRLKGKELYRQYLAEKYGKRKMLFSGIHYNFSFDESLIESAFKDSKADSYDEYKNNLYLGLAKKIVKYSWLIVYLTAASPVFDGSFFDNSSIGKDVISPFSSARCSEIGYWNDFIPTFDYTSLESYADSIQSYVDNGRLKSASELYYPIRLKPRGANSLENLKATGINHIELRMLDLNPLSPIGIFKEDMDFLHMLILYLTSLEDGDFTESQQISAVKNEKRAAKFDDEGTLIDLNGESKPLKAAAAEVLDEIYEFFASLEQPRAMGIINHQRKKITDKNKRYAAIIKKNYGKDYVKKGIQLSISYADTL